MTDYFSLFDLPRRPLLDAGKLNDEFARKNAGNQAAKRGEAVVLNEAFRALGVRVTYTPRAPRARVEVMAQTSPIMSRSGHPRDPCRHRFVVARPSAGATAVARLWVPGANLIGESVA